MTESRRLTELGDIASVIRGVTYKKGQAENKAGPGLLPLLRATNIARELRFSDLVFVPEPLVRERQYLQPGDILLASSSGSLGIVGKAAPLRAPWRGSFGAFCLAIRPNQTVVRPLFLSYYLQTSSYRSGVARLSKGVGINNLRKEHIETTRIPMMPLDAQDRLIAAIESHLTRLEAAEKALHRVRENLDRTKASVLKAAFEGRLTTTEAELARAQKRAYEPASQLLSRILGERKDRWNEARLTPIAARRAPPKKTKRKAEYEEPPPPNTKSLPPLPEGWCVATIDQLASDIRYGTSAKCSPSIEGGVPVLRMGNIEAGKLTLDKLKFLPPDHDEFPALLLRDGDLLFNRTNSLDLVGKSAVFRSPPARCSFASYLIRARLLSGVVPEFVAAHLNSTDGVRWIKTVAVQQVGQANVNASKLKSYVVPLPPLAEQQRITAELDRIFSMLNGIVDRSAESLSRCARLRQAILEWAFEGKLTRL